MDRPDLAFDFSNLDDDDNDDDRSTLWEQYTKLCYSQVPPISALSSMKPILIGDESNALFPYMQVGKSAPILLNMLSRIKIITSLDLSHNTLEANCTQPLIDFVNVSSLLSSFDISNNPNIGPTAMIRLLTGIQEAPSLESLNISNTGCSSSVASKIAQVITGCSNLMRLDISSCNLSQGGIDIASAMTEGTKLKWLNLSNNKLYAGGRRFAQALGQSITNAGTLTRLTLSRNAINDESGAVLLRALADSPSLKHIDLSQNQLNEASGKSLAALIGKTSSLKTVNLSHNPILNVTINKIRGQTQAETGDEGENKKDKKPKGYVPSLYLVINSLIKNSSMKKLILHGLVVDRDEWDQKVSAMKASNQTVEICDNPPTAETLNFVNMVKKAQLAEENKGDEENQEETE